MRLTSLIPAALSGLALLSPVAAGPVAKRDSSFKVVDGAFFTFQYQTSEPDDQNWIGIYSVYNDKPGDGNPAIYWDWTPGSGDTKHIKDDNLNWGAYRAHYMAKGGYTDLADPIDIFLSGDGPISFNVDTFTTKNAREGDEFKARVNGLLHHAPDANTKYSKESGDDWAKLSEDGVVTGTPSGSGDTKLSVKATASDGSEATLKVVIPVVAKGEPILKEISVMSLNIWVGGLSINDYNRKQISAIVKSGADLVGLQESTYHAQELADALGWEAWQGDDVGIISRYPIAERYGAVSRSGSVRVAIDGDDQQVILHNCHLGYDPYGPYDFCFDSLSPSEVLDHEASSGRTPQIKEIVEKMKEHIDNADKIPVFLTGDFNAPSHLDWTEATSEKHCGVGQFDWPSSKYPVDAGLLDSYREIHPDPLEDDGNTWSPIYLNNKDRFEPLDRIDFVYFKGKSLEPQSSKAYMIGNPTPEPDQADNEWPSDHKGVVSVFKISK